MGIERYETAAGPRWRAEFRNTRRDGTSERQSRSFATKREAADWLAAAKAERAAGGRLSRDSAGVALRRWHKERTAAEVIRSNTASGYSAKIEIAVESFGHLPLREVSPEDVEACLRGLAAAGRARSTIAQTRAILHKAFGDFVRRRLIPFNPVDAVELPAAPRRARPRTDTIEDARRFLAALDETRDGAFFRVMAMTGMRRSELGALTWANVDLEGGELRIASALIRESRNGKSTWKIAAPKSDASARRVPLPPQALATLQAHRTRQRAERLAAGRLWADLDLVFPDAIGRLQNLDALSARARTLRIRLGLPEGVQAVHGFRHLFGTTQHNVAGTDVKTLSAMMGHSRTSTTLDLYIEADTAAADAAARKAGDLFG